MFRIQTLMENTQKYLLNRISFALGENTARHIGINSSHTYIIYNQIMLSWLNVLILNVCYAIQCQIL